MTIDKDLLDEIEELMQTGDLMADDLSIRLHTTGLQPSTRAALDEWDPRRLTLRRKLEALREKVDA